MLLVVAGEDSIQSREYIAQLKKKYYQQHASVFEVSPKQLDEAKKDMVTRTLFTDKIIYFTQGLIGHIAKQKKKKTEELKKLHDDDGLVVVDWEDGKSLYSLGLKAAPYLKEFKPDASIFDLLDCCVPGNKQRFIKLLNKVMETQDPVFVFTLLQRHVKSLLVLKHNPEQWKGSPWQKTKMSRQAARWDETKLLKVYEGMTRIDVTLKTNSTPYDLRASLEIIAAILI
jgi:DNA polymerase III delta subunit